MKQYARLVAFLVFLTGLTGLVGAGQTTTPPGPSAPPAPSGAAAPASPQTPTFTVNVEYVEVDAVVTDRDGQFVRNLKQEDFEIFEDGKPQAISAFSIVDIPVERLQRPLYAPTPIEPDVKSNERPFDGRIYVMLIDDLHIYGGRTARVRATA